MALRKAERFDFALELLERGLEVEPGNLKDLREKGMCLLSLALAHIPGFSLDRAREHYRKVLELFPDDPETWALLRRCVSAANASPTTTNATGRWRRWVIWGC